jgi:predicted DNA-binding transcriptional regulator AlpA
MPTLTVDEVAKQLAVLLQERDMTVDQWCEKHGCSRHTFYRMQRAGTAPQTIRVGKRLRITPAADQHWTNRQQTKASA